MITQPQLYVYIKQFNTTIDLGLLDDSLVDTEIANKMKCCA